MVVDEQYVEGAAYHEAAHMVVAAVQGLPLRKGGLRIDKNGAGLACYKDKRPDGSTNIGPDACRERTIIAALAGSLAHGMFYPPVANGDANAHCDFELVGKLLGEMYPGRGAQSMAKDKLYKCSKDLVERYWLAIKALATALWAKPWSNDPPHEKCLEGEEVIGLLRQSNMSAVLDPSEE